jgi:deoxyribodipyrimidine photolyase-related protein
MHYRNLIVVLGDQLDRDSAAFDGFDAARDLIVMAEVREESEHVWSHKARTAYFFSAMRHFRDELQAKGWTVRYSEITDAENEQTLAGEIAEAAIGAKPEKIIVVEPGDYRVREMLLKTAKKLNLPLEIRTDTHFYDTVENFRQHAKGRKQLRLEFYYRELRKRTGILMDGAKPEGGEWNYDTENRGSFGKAGPKGHRPPRTFAPDAVTKKVLADVEKVFPDHPGKLDSFDWPVTPEQAEQALDDFIRHRLPQFGEYQDAMWTAEPWLYHSRLSAAMNLKLLNPRKVVEAAEDAYRRGVVPLAAAEGFIRQILGWREYVRGLYWLHMPKYATMNALKAKQPLPKFYWTGETNLNCLKHALQQTLDLGYAHHIQRLMVTGLFALMLGVEPTQIHEWYLAVYVDAVEWVELPNVLGMSQYADGGIMASKPYAATGKYIQRMSNYCSGCQFDPAEKVGPKACPFTTLYWDFLLTHEEMLAANQRMSLQVKNLARLSEADKTAVQKQAATFRKSLL